MHLTTQKWVDSIGTSGTRHPIKAKWLPKVCAKINGCIRFRGFPGSASPHPRVWSTLAPWSSRNSWIHQIVPSKWFFVASEILLQSDFVHFHPNWLDCIERITRYPINQPASCPVVARVCQNTWEATVFALWIAWMVKYGEMLSKALAQLCSVIVSCVYTWFWLFPERFSWELIQTLQILNTSRSQGSDLLIQAWKKKRCQLLSPHTIVLTLACMYTATQPLFSNTIWGPQTVWMPCRAQHTPQFPQNFQRFGYQCQRAACHACHVLCRFVDVPGNSKPRKAPQLCRSPGVASNSGMADC